MLLRPFLPVNMCERKFHRRQGRQKKESKEKKVKEVRDRSNPRMKRPFKKTALKGSPIRAELCCCWSLNFALSVICLCMWHSQSNGPKNSRIFPYAITARLSGSRRSLGTSEWMGGSAWRRQKLSKAKRKISRRSLVSCFFQLAILFHSGHKAEDVQIFWASRCWGNPLENRSKGKPNRKQGTDSVSSKMATGMIAQATLQMNVANKAQSKLPPATNANSVWQVIDLPQLRMQQRRSIHGLFRRMTVTRNNRGYVIQTTSQILQCFLSSSDNFIVQQRGCATHSAQ